MSSERSLVSRCLDFLNGLSNCKAIKLHGGVFMEAGTPDILAVKNGKAIFLEIKKPGKQYMPTEIQAERLSQWYTAGARCAVIKSVDYLKRGIMKSEWSGNAEMEGWLWSKRDDEGTEC